MYLDIDGLRKQFEQHRYPYWRVYQGKKMLGKFQDDENDYEGEDLIEYAWLQLEELINSYPSGRVVVSLGKNAQDGRDRRLDLPVQWGKSSPTSPGIGNSGSMMPARHGFDYFQVSQQMAQQQREYFDQLLKLNNELAAERYARLRAEEELEYASAPSGKEEIFKEVIGIAKTYVAGMANRPPVSLGTLGQKQTPRESHSVDHNQDKTQIANSQGPSFDAIIADCNKIAAALPEYHINQVITALADFVESNPGQAKLLLGQLMQNNE